MDQLTQKQLDAVKLIKQSEFKKPYLEDDYVPMEYAYYPPGYPPYAPQNPGDSVIPDCKVGVEASGALEKWRDCVDPDEDCSAWIFTCAHKIIQISCGYCTIKKITPLQGDRLEVIVCSDGDSIDLKYQTTENPSKPAEWKKYEDKRECCPKKPISIGYTSQQMACSGTQTLTAVPEAKTKKEDLGDICYAWAITAGGGSLSSNKGNSVVYTAPATNANCANNPTITLTNKSGATATLKIAINCYTAHDLDAYGSVVCQYEQACIIVGVTATCITRKMQSLYFCDGVIHGGPTSCAAWSTSTGGCNDCASTAWPCPGTSWNVYCPQVAPTCVTVGEGTCCAAAGSSCDLRSEAMKEAGCCPAALL